MASLTSQPGWHVVVFDIYNDTGSPENDALALALSKALRERLNAAGLSTPTEGVPDFLTLMRRPGYSEDEVASAQQLRRDIPQGHSYLLGVLKQKPEGAVVELKYITYPGLGPVEGVVRADPSQPVAPKPPVAASGLPVPLYYRASGQTVGGMLAVPVPTIQDISRPLVVGDGSDKTMAIAIVQEMRVPADLTATTVVAPPSIVPVVIPIAPSPPAPAQPSQPAVAPDPSVMGWVKTWPWKRIGAGAAVLGAGVGIGTLVGKKL